MADSISNIIDVAGAQADFATVNKLIDGLEANIDAANAKVLTVTIDAKGLETLTAIVEKTKQQESATQELTQAVQQNNVVAEKSNTLLGVGVQNLTKLRNNTAEGSAEWNKYNEQLQRLQTRLNNSQSAIDKLTTSVKEVGNATEKAGESFKVMGVNIESMFARMVIRMAAFQLILYPIITGVTLLVTKFTELSDAAQAAADHAADFASKMKDIAKNQAEGTDNIFAGTHFDKDKAIEALVIAKNTTKSITERVNAYRDLQSMLPNILTSLTKEQDINGKFTVDSDKVNKAIEYQNKLKQASIDLQTASQANAVLQSARNKIDVNGEHVDQYGFSSSHPGVVQLTEAENAALKKQKEITTELARAQQEYSDAYAGLNKLKVIDDKPKKPTAEKKELDAELKAARIEYETQVELNQKKFDNSQRSDHDEKQLMVDNEAANQLHYANVYEILDKWKGKIGETITAYNNRYAEADKERLAHENQTAEEEQKLWDLEQKRILEEIKFLDDTIHKWQELQNKITEVQGQIKLVKDQSAAHHNYASGASPILEAFGFDGDFQDEQKQRDLKKQSLLKDQSNNNSNLSYLQTKPGTEQNQSDIVKAKEKDIEVSKSLAELDAENQKAIDDKIIEGKKQLGDKTIELAQQTFEAVKTIQENQFKFEQQQLDIRLQQIQLQSQQQIQAINATAGFQITKDNEAAKVAAQTAAQENAIQQQKNQLALKQAIFEKKSAELSILANTAQAIVKTIAAYAGIPGGIAIAAPIIALEAAIGAAQYAAAASAPLPQFFMGGETSTPYFRAGEKGRELGITPSGDLMMFNKDAAYSAPIGTTIKNNADTERLINYWVNSQGVLESRRDGLPSMTDKNIVEKLDELIEVGRFGAMGRQKTQKVQVTVNNHDYLQRPERRR